jgi:hypothetical protein
MNIAIFGYVRAGVTLAAKRLATEAWREVWRACWERRFARLEQLVEKSRAGN